MGATLLALTLMFAVSNTDALAELRTVESPVPNQYIVVLKASADVTTDSITISEIPGVEIRHEYRHTIRGFGVELTNPSALSKIRDLSDVDYIEEDGYVNLTPQGKPPTWRDRVDQRKLPLDGRAIFTDDGYVNLTTQGMPMTWGLDRVDQSQLPLDGRASFTGDGRGVNVYIIDTGIYPDHEYFGGRARVAFDVMKDGRMGVDCYGHGTHCAGTIGANYYGIARQASLWGVRVLSCSGSGTWSGIIKGMDWVAGNHISPAVASMSLGGGASDAVDAAVHGMYDAGVPVSVSAGNSNNDACRQSPARAPMAITVGATDYWWSSGWDYRDYRAWFSNYGACVDIFAPGYNVLSTVIGSPTATATWSGTSMACPHVTGAIAVALGNNPDLTPKQVWEKIAGDSTSGVLQDKGLLSPDRLLYIP